VITLNVLVLLCLISLGCSRMRRHADQLLYSGTDRGDQVGPVGDDPQGLHRSDGGAIRSQWPQRESLEVRRDEVFGLQEQPVRVVRVP